MMPSTSVTLREHFGCIKSEYGDAAIIQAVATGHFNRRDEGLIREFIAERRGSAGISIGRANKITFTLISWRRFLPHFADLTMPDIYTGIEAMRAGKNLKGRPFKQNTQHDYIRILKQFLLWMIENEYTDLPEKKVRKVRTPPQDTMTKRAGDLLTPHEVQALVDACLTSRDRALILTLYEGGFRVGEIGQLRWGDLKVDSKGIAVNLDFKTGIPRYIRLVMSKKYLAEWRADYPRKITQDDLVFLNERGGPLTYAGVASQIRRIARRANLSKRLTPHIFRHSRITHLLREGMKESTLKLMMWGSISSEMLKTYAHLTGGDIDSEISRLYGLEEAGASAQFEKLEPIICPSCNLINPPGEDYCRNCMEPLTQEAIAEEESVQRFVLKNFSTLRRYLDKVERERGELRSLPCKQ